MRRMVIGALLAFLLTTVAAIAANIKVDGKLISTASTVSGPPLQVTSTAAVGNLNADMVDGFHGTELVTDSELQGSASLSRQAYFATDSSFTVPGGVALLEVTVIGGGAGGSRGIIGFDDDTGGGGGGSGFVVTTTIEVTCGTVFTVDVGPGGVGGTVGDPDGTVGTESLFVHTPSGLRVVAPGGGLGEEEFGDGGRGTFGGGGGAPFGLGGSGVIQNGVSGGSNGGAGASGGLGGTGNQAGGGGGGPGGGRGGNNGQAGQAGTQPGAGGGGGAFGFNGAAGDSGSILVRWFGPAVGTLC